MSMFLIQRPCRFTFSSIKNQTWSNHTSMEPELRKGTTENTIQPRYGDTNTHPTLTNLVDMSLELLQTTPASGDHKSMEPELGRGVSENTVQPRYGDGNTHSTLTNQVDMNSERLQIRPVPDHKFMEPELGRAVSDNTVQPKYDHGNTHSTLTGQVDINELLQNLSAPGDAIAPPVVANQAEAVPSAASPNPHYSTGSPSGYNSVNDRDGILTNPQGKGVQSVSLEPVLFKADFPTEASGWSIISESPENGAGYSIHDHMVQADVDWRNLSLSPLSNQPIQNMVHKDGYDPNRIPASVFSSKPAASPMDWSNASNESLFSIYRGNSFSGYQGMFKSGEFPMIEQPKKSQNPFENSEAKANEGSNFSPEQPKKPQNPFDNFEAKANEGSSFSPDFPTLPVTPVEHETQKSASMKDDIIIPEGLPKISTVTTEESKENHGNLNASSILAHNERFSPLETNNLIPNRLSDESAKSSSLRNRLSDESCGSFAFPVLVTDTGKSCSFSMGPDKKEEHPMKQPIRQQIREQSEPQTTTTTQATTTSQAAARNRGCFSWFSGWQRCW